MLTRHDVLQFSCLVYRILYRFLAALAGLACVAADFVSLVAVGFSQHGRVLDRTLRSRVEYRVWCVPCQAF